MTKSLTRIGKRKEIEGLEQKASRTLDTVHQIRNENPPINDTEEENQIKECQFNVKRDDTHSDEQDADKESDKDFTIEKLITNLKIISNIKENEKIYLNDKNIIEIDKSYIPSLSRYYYDRGRNITISFLKEIIDNVMICTDSILTNEQDEYVENDKLPNDFTDYNSDILQRFLLEINKSYSGFDNLIKTYSGDITIISEITVLKEKLATRCVKINNVLRIKKDN